LRQTDELRGHDRGAEPAEQGGGAMATPAARATVVMEICLIMVSSQVDTG